MEQINAKFFHFDTIAPELCDKLDIQSIYSIHHDESVWMIMLTQVMKYDTDAVFKEIDIAELISTRDSISEGHTDSDGKEFNIKVLNAFIELMKPECIDEHVFVRFI